MRRYMKTEQTSRAMVKVMKKPSATLVLYSADSIGSCTRLAVWPVLTSAGLPRGPWPKSDTFAVCTSGFTVSVDANVAFGSTVELETPVIFIEGS